MVIVDWKSVHDYYYVRRKNRVPEEYYKSKLRLIQIYFSDKPITYDTIGGFFIWLEEDFRKKRGREMQNSTRNKYLSLLKVCARLTGTNIDDVKLYNENEDRRETEKLTTQEFTRLCNTYIPYAYDVEYRNFFDILLLKVAVITTQRPSNLRLAKWSDYTNGYLYFKITKNRRPHKVYIPPHIQEEMRKLRRYGEYIFSLEVRPMDRGYLSTMIQKRVVLAAIAKHITASSLRGTGITEYLKMYPIQKVMKISNHQDPKVVINHYYDPENSEIEAIVEDNPFDPEPMTREKILNETSKIENSLNKRGVQAVRVVQNNNVVITIPLIP